jgi:hypothetical protein
VPNFKSITSKPDFLKLFLKVKEKDPYFLGFTSPSAIPQGASNVKLKVTTTRKREHKDCELVTLAWK